MKPTRLENYHIVELSSANAHLADEVLRLLNRTQGDGLFPPDYITELLAREDAVVYVALSAAAAAADLESADHAVESFSSACSMPDPSLPAANSESKVLGAGVSQIISDLKFYEPFGADLETKFAGKKVGTFSTLAVREDLQGHGIGQKISQKRMEWLKNQKVDYIVGISWVSGLKHTSDRVFEKFGFKNVARAENFFGPYSIEKNFVCPGCGGPPCTCPSILYLKEL